MRTLCSTLVILALATALFSTGNSWADPSGISTEVETQYLVYTGSPRPVKFSVLTPDSIDLKMTYSANPESPSDRPIILFVNGFTGTKHNWDDRDRSHNSIMELMYRSGYETATMHYRGHGNGESRSVYKKQPFKIFKWFNPFTPWEYFFPSGKAGAGDTAGMYSPERMTLDIVTAVEELVRRTGRKVVIVGHSMGEMMPKLVLSGVRFDVETGGSKELPKSESMQWINENMYSERITSHLVAMDLKGGRHITDRSHMSRVNPKRVRRLHYSNGEIIENYRHSQRTYSIGVNDRITPLNSNGRFKSEVTYTAYPALIGLGGPSDMDPMMMRELGLEHPVNERELRLFLETYGPFLNWLVAPKKNQNWLEWGWELPLTRIARTTTNISLSLLDLAWKPVTAPTVAAMEAMAMQSLALIIKGFPSVEHAVHKMVVAMIGPEENFDLRSTELKELLRRGFSGVRMGAILKTLHWQAYGYKSRNGEVDFSNRRLHVDSLLVRGDVDFFTPKELYNRELAEQGNLTRFLEMTDTGHLGILTRSRRGLLYNSIMEFFRNPKSVLFRSGHAFPSNWRCRSLFAK